jgi:uncharacterized protein YceH (UPF0502 family)
MNEADQQELVQPQLNAIEARLLGVLMEKQQTTPDGYPLTLNSLLLGCNQKTSREPVSNYNSGEVQRCARELLEKKLIHIDPSGRADRYAQRLTATLGVDKGVQALLCVLLLRGAQTVHELLTRTQRMHNFETDQQVEDILEQLCHDSPPMVRRIPRQTGQREDRFVHLFCGEPDLTAIATKHSDSKLPISNGTDEKVEKLEKRVTELESKVEFLLTELALSPPQAEK